MAINKLIFAFVTLILGIALLGQVAVITNDATGKNKVVDEQITIVKNISDVVASTAYQLADSPTGWKLEDDDPCPLTDLVMRNSSGTDFTITTDYTVTLANGTVLITNASAPRLTSDNITLVSYSYCSDDYLNIGWGRTLINLVGGFFSIALLLVSIALFYSVAKETGLI